MNIAIIPARKGSKGLKDKNIRQLRGTPLFCWTVDYAVKSRLFDKIVVSTDSLEIFNLTPQGIEKVWRQPELATDDCTLYPVVINALQTVENRLGLEYDTIFTLQSTSPLRTDFHIKEAHRKFLDTKADSLLSVKEELHSLWERINGETIPIRYSKENRQTSKPYYTGNGAIFISKRHTLLEGDRLGGKIEIYLMNERDSTDIHTIEDLRLVEWYMEKNR